VTRSRRGRAADVPPEPVPSDVPTPLPARKLVVDRLTDALARAERSTSVLLVDLDHFRMVNALRGHGVGDRLLTAVDARLQAATSSQDVVIRFGDDQFVVICEDTGEHSAHALACLLRNLVADPFLIDGAPVHITTSIGVAAAPAGAAVSATDLLRHADTAAHLGKSNGRGRVHVYEQAVGDDVADRYALAAELPAALAGNELHLEYQPIVDLRSGSIVGVEGLARWIHPQRGPVSPGSFVAVAELSGVAADLDRWAIRQALRDTARLREAGVVPPDAHLAVNVSAVNLTDGAFFADLLGWAESSGLPAGQLVLEITETAIMQDTARAARLLRDLREQGFRVAMDDFGTGYSSLAHLRDLPISALKIDRSFVTDIEDQREALAIVGWVIDLARALGVAVVAEGVETTEQATLLGELGCATAQGWLWGPAVPMEDLLSGRAWTNPLATVPRTSARPRTTSPWKRDGTDPRGAGGTRAPAGRRRRPTSGARIVSERIRRSTGTPDDRPDA
jgi:diguanylate cyclase (GGDEF)-like protein